MFLLATTQILLKPHLLLAIVAQAYSPLVAAVISEALHWWDVREEDP